MIRTIDTVFESEIWQRCYTETLTNGIVRVHYCKTNGTTREHKVVECTVNKN